jgi:murein tripeptide amidase MpaA
MVYFNVDDIEEDIISLSVKYPLISKVIELPNKSIEGRTIHAINIGEDKNNKSKKSILLTGGVHAREWGGSDICMYFAADLLEAYELNKGVRYGGQYFSATEIKKIVNELNIIILPDVNPDGKAYSQSDPRKRLWRGNRNLKTPSCYGVDLNRNFDFVWDFTKYFAPNADVHTSDDPCDSSQTYKGTSPFSEPETMNVKWLLDEYSGIGHYIDIHCNGGSFLHSWGTDKNQSSNPEMNFNNSTFNNIRGISEDKEYQEYISKEDDQYIRDLGKVFHDSVKKSSSKDYEVKQSYDLYPTSGCSDDYSYSRHFLNNTEKIYGFTIEFGKDVVGDFQPPWEEMEKIVIEVSSGLMAFSYRVADNHVDVK